MIQEEIQIIQPDICMFYTNRKYDQRIKDLYEGVIFEEVSGLPFNHFCRLLHPNLPAHTYRTPHPKTIRIQSWEEAFISVMQRELPSNQAAEQNAAEQPATRLQSKPK
ncbi:MAG: hypothetical protein L3J39_17825 [Verrucomicrobiales bacterium]|nr:hypothetical protein [Verrucomicrobiales bacterium]